MRIERKRRAAVLPFSWTPAERRQGNDKTMEYRRTERRERERGFLEVWGAGKQNKKLWTETFTNWSSLETFWTTTVDAPYFSRPSIPISAFDVGRKMSYTRAVIASGVDVQKTSDDRCLRVREVRFLFWHCGLTRIKNKVIATCREISVYSHGSTEVVINWGGGVKPWCDFFFLYKKIMDTISGHNLHYLIRIVTIRTCRLDEYWRLLTRTCASSPPPFVRHKSFRTI